MKQFKFLALTLALSAGTSLWAEVFKFNLIGYPKEERSCHQQSGIIGGLFEEGMQVKVVHVECVKERKTGYDFLIEYESPQKLEFTSTEYYLNVVQQAGRYREKSDCLNNLEKQSALFTKATGLNPVFSYCRSQELEAGKNWEIILIAKGKAPIQPLLAGYLMFSQPQEITAEDISNGISKALEQRGGILADLIFHHNTVMGLGSASIHYFAAKEIRFNMERLSQVPTLKHCLRQAEEVKAFLDSEKQSLFTVYCGGPNFGYFDLHVGTLDKPSFTWQQSADTFTSFSECESHRSEVLSHYAGSPTNPLLGGTCSRDYQTDKYFVMIYKRKRPATSKPLIK